MTQSRLLDIAVREFGLKGLEGASTRGIAAKAGTAMSAITYHYGGKDKLYLAAADHIAARMGEAMAPALDAEDGVGAGDPAAARAAVQRLVAMLFDKMASDDTEDWSLFIMREQLQPGEAFERIWSGMMGRILNRMAELVATATGASTPHARVATLTLLGQAMSVRASRAAVLRLCEIDALDAQTLAHVKARVCANVDAILDRMIAEELP